MKPFYKIVVFISILSIGAACSSSQSTESQHSLFVKMPAEQTGVHFMNVLNEDHVHNIFNFDYMYNGAGVAVGDLDNDGLADIYFTGNAGSNKLYMNQGGFKFEDATQSAGVAADNSWNNGVTLIDINLDGFLDLYVCRSYSYNSPDHRRNLLFINNQDGTFTEQAKQYGIDDVGHSVQSTFFDYDQDGDQDVFIISHPSNFHIGGSERYYKWLNPTLQESNKLYRNNGDLTFTDVSEEAGVLDFSFSLGLIAQDFDQDGFIDLFISNDYDEPDQYLKNQGNGTFLRETDNAFKHISNFGMGVDAGDINNDGWMDLVTVDMLAEDNYREKTQMGSMDPDAFWTAVDWGFHYQYMRNSLHLNNGNGSFSEIGQLAGIHRTDWSWAPILADFNNDGFKDLYVTNGFRRDSRNKDIREKNDRIIGERQGRLAPAEIMQLLNEIPSNKMKNYLFMNNGDYTFTNTTDYNGIGIPSFSNGAAYVDLDNDGDLDLIANNINDTAFVYQNMILKDSLANYIQFELEGAQSNPRGNGTWVNIYYRDQHQSQQHTSTRGYLSSIEAPMHFGLGKAKNIDRVEVIWPNQTVETISNIDANQTYVLNQKNAKPKKPQVVENEPLMEKWEPGSVDVLIKHEENRFDDYIKQILLPHKLSAFGPGLCVGDVDGDGSDDFYVGGAYDQAGRLFVQTDDGFKQKSSDVWKMDIKQEDVAAHFFDSDQDGDLDLYVVSGGNEFGLDSKSYQDRLYINDGQGNFSKSASKIPFTRSSGSVVASSDFDQDGDLDLFIGGRHKPGNYPMSPQSFLLQNNNGIFVDITDQTAGLVDAGMITSALWVDFKNDGFPELVLAGEWMSIRIFDNNAGVLTEISEAQKISEIKGWWSSLAASDIDNDGDLDLIAGNLGRNYKYQASMADPFHLYSQDFDGNGVMDIVLAFEDEDDEYPVRGKQCSSEQIPMIKQNIPTYDEFGQSKLSDIYGEALLDANHFYVNSFESMVFINNNNESFSASPLPVEAQFSPINDMIVMDINQDQIDDIIVAGNLYASEIETGRADAGTGLILIGNGDGSFKPIRSMDSGFWANLDAKVIERLITKSGEQLIMVGNNNDTIQFFKLNETNKMAMDE